MAEQNDNMKLWNSVCVTDPAITKKVVINNVLKFIAICAQSQIKRATELWGPMGGKWGVRDEGYKYATLGDINFCLYTAILYFPDGEISIHSDCEIIHSTGKWKGQYNEDFSKKMATDALTKGLSKRGFNADVFEGKFDDNKYVAELKAQKKNGKQDKTSGKKKQSDPTRQKIVNEITSILTDKVFNADDRKKAKQEIKDTKINKTLSESIVSLKALKATYENEQNERIKKVKKFVTESKKELDIF